MEFFTAGNFLTLLIVLVLLFIFRQMDKNNRHMGKLRNYSDQLKKDLAAFMEVQESSVKDYAISLNVERESAKELMNRIRQTEAALAEKAAMMSQMDDQIKTYENTLAELHRMTGRVQENLNRLRDESTFVDTASKRIGEITNRLDTVDKEVESIESKFERENADALEEAVQSLLASVNSKISDLTATAEVIERSVDDRRQEILRIEQDRAQRLIQDEEHINEVLRNAVEQAGKQSDKMEESVLVVFKQQAEDRIQRLKIAEEDQLKTYEEHAKTRLAEMYAQISALKEEWQAERLAWESKDNALRDERTTSIQHVAHSLESAEKRLAGIRETIDAKMAEANERITQALSSQESALEKTTAEMMQHALLATEQKLKEYSEAQSLEFTRLQTLADDSRKLDEELRQSMRETTSRVQADFARYEQEAEMLRKQELDKFSVVATALKVEITELDKELAALKNSAKDTLLEKFKAFENDFTVELAQRNDEIHERILAWQKSIEDMKQKALEASSQQLEEYRDAQRVEFSRLEALTDDSRKLDEELRLTMKETIAAIKDDFSRYEEEAQALRKQEADKFSAVARELQKEMAGINEGIDNLKSIAVDNVSKSIKLFEEGFTADLSKRGSEVQERILAWQDEFENQLTRIAENAETARRNMEKGITEEMRKTLSSHDERLVAALDHLKAETAAFEERIRSDMNAADESVLSLKEQLRENVADAKKEADVFLTAEIGKQSLASAELVKQYQRDLDGKFRELSESLTARKGEIEAILEASRAEVSESGSVLTEKIRELDSSIEDTRRRMKDVSVETDNRIATVRFTVEETERHIKEAVEQAKVLDRADELRLDLGRRIEDLKNDIERLDQRRAEAAQLENDFVKIRRLEDDVNAKMTRFLSEKHRIEIMEADFSRLLKISKAVEEKLSLVTASDDTLQGIQLQIRKLEEALGASEDKFQRIERKNQILDNTNEGIDKNFRILQESEKLSIKMDGDLKRYGDSLLMIKSSIEKLSGESEKAADALSKIEMLDTMLKDIEDRIDAMQRARKWIADAEGRLEKLNTDAQIQARAIDTIVKGKKSAAPEIGAGAPPPQIKENVISLAKQGWKTDEIAKALKISRGEVELIREMTPWDK